MGEIQQTEGIMNVPKHDEKTEHEINQDGPAPPTSLPPSMIQEEYASSSPKRDNSKRSNAHTEK